MTVGTVDSKWCLFNMVVEVFSNSNSFLQENVYCAKKGVVLKL